VSAGQGFNVPSIVSRLRPALPNGSRYRASPSAGPPNLRAFSNDGRRCVVRGLILFALTSTRASAEIRSSRFYSSCGDVPILRFNSFTASENATVAASYSFARRVFSSQPTLTSALSLFTAPKHSWSFHQSGASGAPMADVGILVLRYWH
jgi:hypothetical protein